MIGSSDVMDLTKLEKLPKAELELAILNAVKGTQAFKVQPYPYIVIMRDDQFRKLKDDDHMMGADDPKYRIYLTELNAMEVYREKSLRTKKLRLLLQ